MTDVELLKERLLLKKHDLTMRIEKSFHAQQLTHDEIIQIHDYTNELYAVSYALEEIEDVL